MCRRTVRTCTKPYAGASANSGLQTNRNRCAFHPPMAEHKQAPTWMSAHSSLSLAVQYFVFDVDSFFFVCVWVGVTLCLLVNEHIIIIICKLHLPKHGSITLDAHPSARDSAFHSHDLCSGRRSWMSMWRCWTGRMGVLDWWRGSAMVVIKPNSDLAVEGRTHEAQPPREDFSRRCDDLNSACPWPPFCRDFFSNFRRRGWCHCSEALLVQYKPIPPSLSYLWSLFYHYHYAIKTMKDQWASISLLVYTTLIDRCISLLNHSHFLLFNRLTIWSVHCWPLFIH